MTLADAIPPDLEVVDIGEILVGVDGHGDGERALGVATWLSQRFGARLDVVAVAPAPDPTLEARVQQLARQRHCARGRVLVGTDPAGALAAELGFGDRVLGCLATHGRNHLAPIAGSVSMDVVEQVDHPVVLVGPHAAAQHREGPVVVCVDGRTGDAELVAVGAAWARALGRTSYLATVAEPAPPSLRGPAHEHRARCPAEPEAHLAELRHDLDPEAGTEVVYDPVSVADGLRPLLARLAPSLVVVGTRRRRGVRRLVLGDHGAAVVHEAPAPVLVVPLGLRR